MAIKVEIELHKPVLATLLKGADMERIVLGSARRIAAAAGPGMEASSRIGRTRARASVITATPEARLAEAKTRRLSSSLRAGA